MSFEIERKFLVSSESWRGLAQGVLYRQGYLCRDKEHTVRVRLVEKPDQPLAFLSVKGDTPQESHFAQNRQAPLIRAEFEYKIPIADAQYMLDHLAEKPIVEKYRYHIPFCGKIWEVDEFLGVNAGLILAEIELESENQPFERPPWLGQEVSGDPRYANAHLKGYPFREIF